MDTPLYEICACSAKRWVEIGKFVCMKTSIWRIILGKLLMSLHMARNVVVHLYNPLGNLNSRRSRRAKLIRSTSLQLVFDAAISKLLWRLVSRCFYMSICVFSTIGLKWLVQFECVVMWENVYRQSPDGNREIFKNIMLGVFRILDKLHIFSNILCTCSIFIKMWAQILGTCYSLFVIYLSKTPE